MEKTTAIYLINNFGINEEIKLIREGKNHEAFQIRHARQQLMYAYAMNTSVYDVKTTLNIMTEYTIDDDGYWNYNPIAFVHDEFTRNLLDEFKSKFAD